MQTSERQAEGMSGLLPCFGQLGITASLRL